MDAATARSLLERAVARLEKLHTSQQRGFVHGESPQELSLFLTELQDSSNTFMTAVQAVNQSGLDDLLLHNTRETLHAHMDAYVRCEHVLLENASALERAMALTAVDAHYIELSETQPLTPVHMDQDAPFSLFLEPLSRPLPVSGVQPAKRLKVEGTAPRRSARLAALRAPSGPAPDTQAPLIQSLQPSVKEVEQASQAAAQKSRQRAAARRRPQTLKVKQLPAEAVTSLVTQAEGSWFEWAATELQDPSTSILDSVAAVSSALARDFSLPASIVGSALFQRFMRRFVRSIQPDREQELSAQLGSMRTVSGAALLQNFQRLYQGSLSQITAVTTGSLVELLYHFVTLSAPAGAAPLPSPERSRLFQFLHKWSPFLALALALSLLVVRQDVAAWLLTPKVLQISGGSVQLALSTPGGLATSLASRLLPADSAAVRLLEQFYEFAAEGISALQREPLSLPLRNKLIEWLGFVTGRVTSGNITTWFLGYYDFLSQLHRLQFAAPLLHVFSLVERGTHLVAQGWSWTVRQLKRWVREDTALADILDWATEFSDIVLLMIRFFAQLFRYRGILLLLLTLLQSLLLHGTTGTAVSLQRPLTFGGIM